MLLPQGGYFLFIFAIKASTAFIAITKVSNKITSTICINTPFHKGVETAATVPLREYYSENSANMQDKVKLCNKKTAKKTAADD